MSVKLPKDCSARAVATRARSIVPYKLNSEKWEWHEQTGTDHGTDMIIELVEDTEFPNRKIEAQIKGRTGINTLKNGDMYFDLDVKTVNYALNSSNAFVLFLVDIISETVYYLPIQDYFIVNPDKLTAADKNQSTIRLHISRGRILCSDSEELCDLAKATYIGGRERRLRKIID